VHVAEALLARTDRDEWRCEADEPEWLPPAGEVPEALTMAAGPRGELLELFIDCHWPRRFLAREED
jgi:hypothetical protein